MLTVLIQYNDRKERIISTHGEIEYADGLLTVGEDEFDLESGDRAFVMNGEGQTVWKKFVK